jgi:hypothetical protein
LVGLGLAASLVSAARRWKIETRNRSVEITLDFSQVQNVAAAEGKPLQDVLQRFHDAGVTSIAIQEDTVGSLEEGHRIDVMAVRNPNRVNLAVTGADEARRVEAALRAKLRGGFTVDDADKSDAFLQVNAPYAVVRGLGVGLDPKTVAEVRESGLGVVGRVANYNGVRPEGIVWTLQGLKKNGVHTVIFAGDEMLGYKAYLADAAETPGQASTASALHAAGLNVGIVEFGKMKGDAILTKAAAPNVVRVHTVTNAEMATADIPSNIQRFLLAARERNIRLLYVRLFPDEPDVLETNAKYIESIVAGLDRGDLLTGPAHGYAELMTPLSLRALMGLGVAAAWLLLVDSITGLFVGGAGVAAGAVATIGALALAVLPCAPMLLGVKAAAFAAACVFPSLALLHTDLLAPSARPVAAALGRFLLACAITGVGIAAIVGLLADRLFLIKADVFAGIKVAELAPIVLVALIYGMGLRATPERSFPQAVSDAKNRLFDLASEPIRFWQVAVAAVALGVLVFLVARSGNDPGVGVSPFELKIRAILDRLLYARPRFKEFLIGHPALLLGLLFAAEGRRKWALPLLVVGAIGQESLLNTFCHLHTPLLVSLWRAVLGIVIGVFLGFVLYLVLRPAGEKRPAGSAPSARAA